jgi:hypothetical protein
MVVAISLPNIKSPENEILGIKYVIIKIIKTLKSFELILT